MGTIQQKHAGMLLTTENVNQADRREWLQDMISREYTKVEVIPESNINIFNEMSIYELDKLRISKVRSNSLTIKRLKYEPYHASQDNYLGVVLLSGKYHLEQGGRDVYLKPGEMTIYDATRPHQIQCSQNLTKLLITIPRTLMQARLSGVEHCVARCISGNQGLCAITSSFIHSIVQQAENIVDWGVSALSEQSLDLFTLSLASLNSQSYYLSRTRLTALRTVQDFIEHHLSNPRLNTAMVESGTGFSGRYINQLLNDEDTSLMRYILQRRLEKCSKDLLNLIHTNNSISEIAFKWGFNDLSHFSRTFKIKYGCSPKQFRHQL